MSSNGQGRWSVDFHYYNWLGHDVSNVFRAMHDGDSEMTAQMFYELVLQSGHVADAVKEVEICLCQAAKVFGLRDVYEMASGIGRLVDVESELGNLVAEVKSASFQRGCESGRHIN